MPRDAIQTSDTDRGPRPESTASAPSSEARSAAGSAAARWAVTIRVTRVDSFVGSRTTAVISWPVMTACSSGGPRHSGVGDEVADVLGRPFGEGEWRTAQDLLDISSAVDRLPDPMASMASANGSEKPLSTMASAAASGTMSW